MHFGQCEFVTRVGSQCIMRHHLLGHARSCLPVDSSRLINSRQFLLLAFRLLLQFNALASEISIFRISLGADRDILSGRHGHCSGEEGGNACEQHARSRCLGRRDPDDEARRRHDAVICAKDRRPKPTDTCAGVSFRVTVQSTHRGAPFTLRQGRALAKGTNRHSALIHIVDELDNHFAQEAEAEF